MDIITATEDAIIDRVKALLGDSIRQAASLPGDLDEETLKQLLIAAPGVYAKFAGGALVPGSLDAAIEGRWTLFVITAHASGGDARRRGDKMQIGAYPMLAILARGLNGYTVPDVGIMTLRDMSNLFSGAIDRQGCALYGLTFGLPMEFGTGSVDPGDLDDFITFHGDWDLAPVDAAIDASDTVTLPQ